MNNIKLIRELKHSWQVRCKYWSVCPFNHCDHHEPHHARNETCLYSSPVKYCAKVEGFVYDVPYTGDYAEDECDPNLAFKAKRDAQHRRSGKSNFVEAFNGETVDITTHDSQREET